MRLEGVPPVGIGALVGVIITSAVAVIAQCIKRDTTLRSHIIDDRGKITADTAAQLTQALTRLDKADEHIDLITRDKNTLVNIVLSIKSELTLLAGLFDQIIANISTDVIDAQALRRNNSLIIESIVRIRALIRDSEIVSASSKNLTSIPSTLPTDKKT